MFKTKHITRSNSRVSYSEERSSCSFASDVLKLVGGTAFAQILAVMASPLITRLYGPEAFGTSALFVSIVGIVGVVACLRFDLAIMLPEKDEDAANLLGLSLSLAIIAGMIMFLACNLSPDLLLSTLNAPVLMGYLWLLPIAIFLAGAFNSLNYWNSRTRQFGRLSIARINASVAAIGTQIGAGFAGHATGGSLIVANILGSMVSTLVLAGQILRDDHRMLFRSIRFKGMKACFFRYRKFPLFDTWSGLLNSLSSQLPIFIFSAFFSPTIVGYYSLGHMVLQLPMTFFGGAVGNVFFQRASEANLKGNLPSLVEITFTRLFMLGLYPILIIFIIGGDIFPFFFGNTWAEAGIYAQILSPWILFVFVASPIATVFAILERQETFLMINMSLFISRAVTLSLGGFIGNARYALILYSISGLLLWIYICLWIFNRLRIPLSLILKKTSFYLYMCLPIVLLLIIGKYFLNLAPFLLIILSASGALIYYFYNIKNDKVIKEYLVRISKRLI